MTPKERVAELIEAGAAITALFPSESSLTFTLAGAYWLTGPTRLRWAPIFPEHQGHIHETEYDEARLMVEGRDVGLFLDGRMVAYVCPVEESGLSIDDARDGLAEWRDLLSKHNNAAQFAEFLAEA